MLFGRGSSKSFLLIFDFGFALFLFFFGPRLSESKIIPLRGMSKHETGSEYSPLIVNAGESKQIHNSIYEVCFFLSLFFFFFFLLVLFSLLTTTRWRMRFGRTIS